MTPLILTAALLVIPLSTTAEDSVNKSYPVDRVDDILIETTAGAAPKTLGSIRRQAGLK